MLMTRILHNSNQVSICNKDKCIHANGQNANLLALGIFTMFVLFGISALTSK